MKAPPHMSHISSSNWEVSIEDDGRTLVVTPRGEIDIATAPDVDAALRRCTDGHVAVVCDLSQVEFMDSSGIRMLLDAREREPHRFAIANPAVAAEKLLEVTGVERVFRRVFIRASTPVRPAGLTGGAIPCPLCDESLSVGGTIATCPSGHRFRCTATRTTPSSDDQGWDLGERLADTA
jgi:anti-sigma B factor antagonist